MVVLGHLEKRQEEELRDEKLSGLSKGRGGSINASG